MNYKAVSGPGGIQWILVSTISLLLAFTPGCSGEKGSSSIQDQVNGKVQFLTGDVRVDGAMVKVDDPLTFGQKIETGEKSSVEIVADDGVIVRIGQKSRAKFEIQKGDSKVILDQGWLAAVKSGSGEIKNLSVVTPTAVAAVRGTSICLKVESSESTYACTCNGTVHWHEAGDSKEEKVTASEHKAFYYNRVDGKIVREEATLKFHKSEDLDRLATKINHTIDWKR